MKLSPVDLIEPFRELCPDVDVDLFVLSLRETPSHVTYRHLKICTLKSRGSREKRLHDIKFCAVWGVDLARSIRRLLPAFVAAAVCFHRTPNSIGQSYPAWDGTNPVQTLRLQSTARTMATLPDLSSHGTLILQTFPSDIAPSEECFTDKATLVFHMLFVPACRSRCSADPRHRSPYFRTPSPLSAVCVRTVSPHNRVTHDLNGTTR